VVNELLAPLDVAAMVLTLDALHPTKKTARLITDELNAHYLLIVKGNQPLAHQAAQELLSGTDIEFAHSSTTHDDRGHGRTEHRTLRTAPADDTLFPGARQVLRLRRDAGGLDGVRTRKEIVFGITSLPANLAGPEHLNHYAREHWCVENRLHWVRDVTFGEDNSQLRTGTAPRALASFRNLALNACRPPRARPRPSWQLAPSRRHRKDDVPIQTPPRGLQEHRNSPGRFPRSPETDRSAWCPALLRQHRQRLRRRPSPWPPHRRRNSASELTPATRRESRAAFRPISTRLEPATRLRSFTH
jgi:predicted transposase YbfD/YdcC